MLQFDTPVKCFQEDFVYEPQYEAKSYFNMDGLEEIPFLNYWNTNQTLLLEGPTTLERLQSLRDLVSLKTNNYAETYESNVELFHLDFRSLSSLELYDRQDKFRRVMNNH